MKKEKTETSLDVKEGFYKCAGKCGKIKPVGTESMFLKGLPVCSVCAEKGDW